MHTSKYLTVLYCHAVAWYAPLDVSVGFSEEAMELHGDTVSLGVTNFAAPYSIQRNVVLHLVLMDSLNRGVLEGGVCWSEVGGVLE